MMSRKTTCALLTGIMLLACAGVPDPDANPSPIVEAPPETIPAPAEPTPPLTGRPTTPDAPFEAVSSMPEIPGWTFIEALKGPFGPADDCIVAVYENPDGAGSLHGRLTCGTHQWDTGPLTSFALHEFELMTTTDVDGDGYADVLVKGRYMSGIGPEGAVPFPVMVVLHWNGEALSVEEPM